LIQATHRAHDGFGDLLHLRGQGLDRIGHHGEARPRLASALGLDRGIERHQPGLQGHLGDLLGGIGHQAQGVDHLAHLLPHPTHGLAGLVHGRHTGGGFQMNLLLGPHDAVELGDQLLQGFALACSHSDAVFQRAAQLGGLTAQTAGIARQGLGQGHGADLRGRGRALA